MFARVAGNVPAMWNGTSVVRRGESPRVSERLVKGPGGYRTCQRETAPEGPRAAVTGQAAQTKYESLSLAGFRYRVGASFAGELVEAVVTAGLVQIFHQQVLVATHVQRRPPHSDRPQRRPAAAPRARRPASGPSVVLMADRNGSISFAGAMYRAGRMWARCQVTVTLVAGSVQLSVDGKFIRVHPARPGQRTRGVRHPQCPAPQPARRGLRIRTVTDLPEPTCYPGTGT
jgi:hypothetical protein